MTTEAAMRQSVYSAEDYADNYPDGMERHYWTQARFRVVLRELRRHGALTGRVLDFGAGRGAMVGWLREQGIDAWGIEPGPAPVSAALRSHVTSGAPPEALPSSERELVSDILLLDVLEHVATPETLLADLRALFPRLRALLVTVPARAELWSNYDERFGHYRRYDRAGLLELLEHQPGLRVEACRYFFRPLYPAIWFLAHMPTGRSTVMRPPQVPGVHLLFAKALDSIDRVLPAGWFGSSLIAAVSVT